MSEMIEKVAKAMWDARRGHANNSGVFLEFWGDGSIPKKNGILDEARAAIAAMREPTEMMLWAGNEQLDCAGELRCWQAMIDEALR
jgi:hypothetical protein